MAHEENIGKQAYVECPLPDGAMVGHLGVIVEVTPTELCIDSAAHVSHTGRRYKFFAGELDNEADIEPIPDGQIVSLPRWGAIVTLWPHEIPRKAK
jgi:hypothetical protein